MYSYRTLTQTDTSSFKELLEVFWEAFEGDGYTTKLPDGSYLSELLKKEHFVVLVAEFDGVVVGGLAAFLLEKWEQKRKEMFIYDLAVAKNHRRRGVASALINVLKGVAKERGAYAILSRQMQEMSRRSGSMNHLAHERMCTTLTSQYRNRKRPPSRICNMLCVLLRER